MTAAVEVFWLDALERMAEDSCSGLGRLAAQARVLEALSPEGDRLPYRHAPAAARRARKLPTDELAALCRRSTGADVDETDVAPTFLELVDCVVRTVPPAGASRDQLIRWGREVRANVQGQLVARDRGWVDFFTALPLGAQPATPRDPLAIWCVIVLEIFDLAVAFAARPSTSFGAAVLGVIQRAPARGAAPTPVYVHDHLSGRVERFLSIGFARAALNLRSDWSLGKALAARHGLGGRRRGLREEAPGAVALHARELLNDPKVVSVLDAIAKLTARVDKEITATQVAVNEKRQAELVVDSRAEPSDFTRDFVLRDQRQRAFRRAGLTPPQREWMLLRGQDRPSRETAERFGVAEGTVETQLTRARHKLRPHLEESV